MISDIKFLWSHRVGPIPSDDMLPSMTSAGGVHKLARLALDLFEVRPGSVRYNS
jgi:hypothetical protein